MKEEYEVVEYEENNEETGGLQPGSGQALAAFILMVVGFDFACSYYLSFIGMILGIIALSLNRETEQQPFKTFRKFTFPFAVVEIVLGALLSSIFIFAFGIGFIGALL